MTFTQDPFENALEEPAVDAGFFYLSFGSKMFLGNDSVITNCRGSVAAVLYASSDSTVELSNGITFENNYSPSGPLLYFTKMVSVFIDSALFINNMQSDIVAYNTDITITNSVFEIGY